MFNPVLDENGILDIEKTFATPKSPAESLSPTSTLQSDIGGVQGALAVKPEAPAPRKGFSPEEFFPSLKSETTPALVPKPQKAEPGPKITPETKRSMELLAAVQTLNQKEPGWENYDPATRRATINIALDDLGGRFANADELEKLRKQTWRDVNLKNLVDVFGAVSIPETLGVLGKSDDEKLRYFSEQQLERALPKTIGRDIAGALTYVPPFMAEIGLTGGLAFAGKMAARKGGTKAIEALSLKGLEAAVKRNLLMEGGEIAAKRGALEAYRAGGQAVARKASELAAGQIPGRVALRGAETVAATTARMPAMLPKVIAQTTLETLPNNLNLNEADKALVAQYIGETPGFGDAFTRNILNTYVEMWSEGLGELFGGTARALTGVEKLADMMPSSVRRLFGAKALGIAAKNAKGSRTAFLVALERVARGAQLDNFIAEWGEEDVGQFVQWGITQIGQMFDVPGLDLGVDDPTIYGNKREMLVRGAALAAPQFARAGAARALGGPAPRALETDDPARQLQNLLDDAAGPALQTTPGAPAVEFDPDADPVEMAERAVAARADKQPQALIDDATPVSQPKPPTAAPGTPPAGPSAAVPTPGVVAPAPGEIAQPGTMGQPVSPDSYVLPKHLSKSAPNFKTHPVTFESDFDRAAYIIHSKRNNKSKAHQEFVASVTAATGLTEQQIIDHGASLKGGKGAIAQAAQGKKEGARITLPRQSAPVPVVIPVEAVVPEAQPVVQQPVEEVPNAIQEQVPAQLRGDVVQPEGAEEAPAVGQEADAAESGEGVPESRPGAGEEVKQPPVGDASQWKVSERRGGVAVGWEKDGVVIRKTSRKKTNAGTGGTRYTATVGNNEYAATTLAGAQQWADAALAKLGTEEAPVAEKPAPQKQMWEMTRDEFEGYTLLSGVVHPSLTSPYATDLPKMAASFTEEIQAIGAPNPGKRGEGVVRIYPRAGARWTTDNEYRLPEGSAAIGEITASEARSGAHRTVVQKALEQGQSIPRAVLEEYAGEPWADEALAKLGTEEAPVAEKPKPKQVAQARKAKAEALAKKKAEAKTKTPVEKPAPEPTKKPFAKMSPAERATLSTLDYVKGLAEQFTGEAKNAVETRVVETEAELPKSSQVWANGKKVAGLYHVSKGKKVTVFLVSSTLKNTAKKANVSLDSVVYAYWLHEQGHHSLRSLFSEKAFRDLTRRIFKSVGRERILELVPSTYTDSSEETLGEEYLTHLIQGLTRDDVAKLTGVDKSIWESIANAIRAALGLKRLSDKDIYDIVAFSVANIYVRVSPTPAKPAKESPAFAFASSASESAIGEERPGTLNIPGSYDKRLEFHNYMQAIIGPELGRVFGLKEKAGVRGVGSWKGENNPLHVRQFEITPSMLNSDGTLTKEAFARLKSWAAAYGIIYRQDATSVLYVPDVVIPGNAPDASEAVVVDAGRPLTVAETSTLANYLEGKYGNDIAYVTTANGVVVLNWTGQDLVPGIITTLPISGSVHDTIVQSGLVTSKDENKPYATDQNYVRVLHAEAKIYGTGNPGSIASILRRVRAYRGKATQAAERYSEEHGYPFKRDRSFPKPPEDIGKVAFAFAPEQEERPSEENVIRGALKGLGLKKTPTEAEITYIAGDAIKRQYSETIPLTRMEQEQTSTEKFKKWFRKSVLRQSDGTPRPMFFGTMTKTRQNIFNPDRSDFGIHVGTVAQAENFTKKSGGAVVAKGRMYKLWVRAENPIRLEDREGIWETTRVAHIVKEMGIISEEEYDAIVSNKEWYNARPLRELLKKKGYDSIVYLNRHEGRQNKRRPAEEKNDYLRDIRTLSDEAFLAKYPTAEDSYMLFDEQQVKSATANTGQFSEKKDIRFAFAAEEGQTQWGKSVDGVGGAITYFKDLWSASKIPDKDERPDITRADLLLRTIPHYSKKVWQLKEVMEHAFAKREDTFRKAAAIFWRDPTNEESSELTALDRFRRLFQKQWLTLTDYLWNRDMNAIGYRVTEKGGLFEIRKPGAKLSDPPFRTVDNEEVAWEAAYIYEAQDYIKNGGSKQAAEALLNVRHITHRMFLQLQMNVNELMERNKEAGVETQKVKGPDGEWMTLQEALRHMGDRRGYYMPRSRPSGEYQLWAEKEGENPVLEVFDTAGYIKVGGINFPTIVGRAKRAAHYKRLGYKVSMSKSSQSSEEAFSALNIAGMNDLIQNALERMSGKQKVSWSDMGMRAVEEPRKDPKGNPILAFVIYGIPKNEDLAARFKDYKGMHYPVPGTQTDAWHFTLTGNATADKAMKSALLEMVTVSGVHQTMTQALGVQLTTQIANMIHARGSRSHKIARNSEAVGTEVYVGYERDVIKALGSTGWGIASGSARNIMARKMLETITGTKESWNDFKKRFVEENPDAEKGDAWKAYMEQVREQRLDSSKQKKAYDEAISYMQEMLRVASPFERGVGIIRGLAGLKYLSGIAPGLVNLTALLTSVPASMHTYAKIPFHRSAALIARNMNQYTKYYTHLKWGKGQALTGEDAWLFGEMTKRGYDSPQWEHEAMSLLMGRMGRSFAKTMEMALVVFSTTERINRALTIAATYYGIKEQHKGEWGAKEQEAALTLAKEVSDNAHATYGPESHPAWTRGPGWGQVARSAYMFKTFSHNFLQILVDMGFNQKDYKSVLFMLGAPALLAGGSASLAMPAIKGMIWALATVIPGISPPDDPEEDFYAWAKEHFGWAGERFTRSGAIGVLGPNLKGSLAIGITDVPTNLREILGAPVSVFTDIGEAVGYLARGDVLKGVEKAVPRVLAGPVRSVREYTQGVTGKNNQPIYYGEEPIRGSEYDAILRFMGFNPAAISGKTEQQWHERKNKRLYDEAKTDIGARVRAMFARSDGPSRPEWIALLEMIEEYNARVLRNNPFDVTPIKKSTLKRWVTDARVAPKRERVRAGAEELDLEGDALDTSSLDLEELKKTGT